MGLLPIAVMLLVFGMLIAACTSDDDDGGNDGDGADATEPANGGGEATEPADDGDGDGGSQGSGSATLAIGNDSWSFDDVFCAFSPEDAGNDRVSFTLSAFGETAEGVRIQLDATIQDPDEAGRYEGNGVIFSVSLDDVEDFANPSVGWLLLTGFFTEVDPVILVDGKTVTVDTIFDDALTDDVIEEVPGTLRGTCP